MENHNRIFFHEVGHFVAARLNISSNPIVEPYAILFERHPITGEFRGRLENRVVDDHSAKVPGPSKALIAEYIAQLYYGCIFQSYYLNTDFSECFGGHGIEDQHAVLGILMGHKIFGIEPDVLNVAKDHLKSLIDSSGLKDVMNLNPSDYIIKGENNFSSVNFSKLVNDTSSFIESHRGCYTNFLNEIRELL